MWAAEVRRFVFEVKSCVYLSGCPKSLPTTSLGKSKRRKNDYCSNEERDTMAGVNGRSADSRILRLFFQR